MRVVTFYAPLVLAVLAACSSPLVASGSVRVGRWGGSGVVLEATERGGQLELDCAHGTLNQTLDTDGAGQFGVDGTLTLERPGPERDDDPPRARRAWYAGRADERTMSLSITLTDTDEKLGPFTLTFGTAGRLRKCL